MTKHRALENGRESDSTSDVTVSVLLAEQASERPDAIAITSSSEGQAGARDLTFAELHALSERTAYRLMERGLSVGQAVAWIADNVAGLEALVLYHGIAAAGGVSVPINPRFSAPELAAIFEQANPELVLHTELLTDKVDRAVTEARLPKQSYALLSTVVESDELSSAQSARVKSRVASSLPDQPAVVLHTSGTTGRSKGVMHTHRTSVAAGRGWARAMGLTPADTVQSPYPVCSGAGLHFNGLACLSAGARFAVELPDVPDMLDGIERLGTTVFVAVPAIYQFWLADPEFRVRDLSSLRLLNYGGAAMPPSVISQLREAMPSVGLLQTYGLTEAGPGGTYLPEEFAVSKLGSIGDRGAGGMDFRVVDNDGADVARNEVGELLLRGPSIMIGYQNDQAATEDVLSPDGWLRTGDLAEIDPDGFLYFVDRRKDIIVRGGYNIGSLEVEEALCRHPSVVEAAVIGTPHDRLGEQIAAFVVLREGTVLDEEDLLAHCGALLADFKLPSTIEFRSELPHNGVGKIEKTALRTNESE